MRVLRYLGPLKIGRPSDWDMRPLTDWSRLEQSLHYALVNQSENCVNWTLRRVDPEVAQVKREEVKAKKPMQHEIDFEALW
jgi:hypothetical protein